MIAVPQQEGTILIPGTKRLPVPVCCCCCDLRVGAIIIFGLQLIGGILSTASVNSSGALAFDIIFGILEILFAITGLVGIFKFQLKLLRTANYWMFAKIGIAVLLMIIFVAARVTFNQVNDACVAQTGDNPPCQFQCRTREPMEPTSSDTCEDCCERVANGAVTGYIVGTLIGNLFYLYFAICVLSYYIRMENELPESEGGTAREAPAGYGQPAVMAPIGMAPGPVMIQGQYGQPQMQPVMTQQPMQPMVQLQPMQAAPGYGAAPMQAAPGYGAAPMQPPPTYAAGSTPMQPPPQGKQL